MQELLMIRMGSQPFLIRLHDVMEIVRPVELTPVPMAPDHLLGLANVHGQIVCIIDPCAVLRLETGRQAMSARTRFVVLRHPHMHVGVWADEVASISRIPASELPENDADDRVATLGTIDLVQGAYELLNTKALFR